MKHESKEDTERTILERVSRLDSQQIAEVMDFIELLVERKRRETPLALFLNETAGPAVRLEEVRARLAKIPGRMADTVREQRDGRG